MGETPNCSRRRLLAALAGTSVAGLAGCTGGTDDAQNATETTRQTTDAPAESAGFFPTGPEVGLRRVADGPLAQPVAFATANEDRDRRFVADQNGLVYVHGADGIREEPFLDVRDRMISLGSSYTEMGLLGLAFHPDFGSNRRAFLRYSAPPREDGYVGPDDREIPERVNHTFVLSEFRATEDFARADPDSERVLLEIPEPQSNHNAGAVAFGPDGYLYVAVGDGGGANDVGAGHVSDWYDSNEGGNGQDVTRNLLGSVLRIDADAESESKPYGVPEDNPLVGAEGLDEQFAWGFRNPWRFSFDAETGRLFVADVGQNLFEEVSLVEKGGNYGWNVREASNCFDAANPSDPPEDCPDATPADVRGGEPLEPPIIEYPHSYEGETVGRSVVGGHVCRGAELPNLRGQYVFGDWNRRLFVSGPPDGDGSWETRELVVAGNEDGRPDLRVLAFGRGRDGELYVLTSETRAPEGNGGIHRIVPPGEGD